MANENLTKAQYLAINGDFKNVLVSASAGSGKTFVMINRIIRLVVDGKAHLNEILCVTFTDFAAREMKQKLLKAINKEIAKSTGEKRTRLLEEIELLPTANISTIHTFCSGLLREFFYEAGIDSGFKIIDSTESKMLANSVIDRLFEDLYEQKAECLENLLPYYFNKRSDGVLKKAVLNCYYSIMSEENPLEILDNGKKYYTLDGLTEIYEYFYNEFKLNLDEVKQELSNVLNAFSTNGKLHAFALQIFNNLELAESQDEFLKLKEVLLSKLSSKPSITKKSTDEEVADDGIFCEFYNGTYKNLKEELSKMDLLEQAEELARLEGARQNYNDFCEIVKAFYQNYQSAKREENAVDFSDLEHLTKELLQNPDVKAEVQSRFKYVFTDEYQDTSGIQEAILLSIVNNNWFMVGDIKQSIYNFRGCSPEIFGGKYHNFKHLNLDNVDFASEQSLNIEEDCVVNLDKNFRSTKAVLTSVNKLFSSVMTQSFGGTNYVKNPMQVGATIYEQKGDNGCVKLYTIEKSPLSENKIDGVYSVEKHLKNLENSEFNEGRQVVKIINDLIDTKQVIVDKDGNKKIVNYGDITILLRNANTRADRFAKQLMRAGIPVSASTKNSIGEYAEIALAVNILQLIASFNQDIPLVAVLKSPIGKLTEGELMQIRKRYKRGSFCDAYRNYLQNESDYLSEKLKEFDGYIKKVSLLSEFLSCDEILSLIVSEKSWDTELLATVGGEVKLNRLNLFIRASGAKKQTVSEFLQGIDQTLESLTSNYSEENAVKIMSIHASKGLEFPVVILASCAGLYNEDDCLGEFITHKKLGVALCSKDVSTMKKSENAFRTYLRYLNKKELKEEELRILYVAMTRAQNRLYITGEHSASKRSKTFTVPPKAVHGASDGKRANGYFSVFARSDFEDGCTLEISNEELNSSTDCKPRECKQVLIGECDEELKNVIARNLTFNYPGIFDTILPVKRSVTKISVPTEEQDDHVFEYAPIYGDSSAEKGTAYHRFLELCDFSCDAESEFNRLIGERLLTDDQINLIDLNRLKSILNMPIFESLNGFDLYREQPFTCFIPASIIQPNYVGEENVFVQGIIDLLAIKGDRAIIVDYKYTSIKNAEDIANKYRMQLKLYALAVEKVLGVKVEKTVIADIYSARVIAIDIND